MNNMVNVSDIDMEKWLELAEVIVQDRQHWTYKLYTTIMLAIFVAAVLGNTLTCAVIYCDKNMHTPTNYYLFNLAISDLLGSFGILLDVTGQLEQPDSWFHPDFGRYACKLQYFTVLTLWNNSILIMTVLAVERYLAICYPMKLRSHSQRVKKIIGCIWIAAILEALPEMFLVNLTRGKNFSFCFTVPTKLAKKMYGIMAVLTFIVPLIIMTIVYTLIGFKINITQQKRSWETTFNRQDNRCKINKLIVTLTLSFIVCWLPYFIIRMALFIGDLPFMIRHKQFWCISYYITAVNGWFSPVLNPLLFSLISSKFRRSLKNLWNKKILLCRWRESEIHRANECERTN